MAIGTKYDSIPAPHIPRDVWTISEALKNS